MTFSAGKIRQASRRLSTAILHVLPAVLLAFVLAVSGVSGALAAGVLHTEAAQAKGRDIYLVYDDSGSMVSGTVVRWSQAKYAMEVFAALMGAGDTMSIFPMSQNENGANFSFPVNGSDSNRVRTVHEMNYGYGNTPSLAVANAMNAALEASSAKERWVVVLTDGAFDDANNDGGVQGLALVQGYLDQCNAAGIKTAYLAIGDAALLANANPAAGAYAEKAEDNSVSILQKITSIANQIFQHQIVPGSRIQESGGTTKLSIDIPTDQLIVFAQGDNVNLGKVTLNGKRIDGSFQQVKYADDPSLYPKSNASVDTSLKGVVFTCDAGKEPYEDGTFEVEISGASTVEYYITAGVDVVCELSRDGQPVESGETVGAGKYEYKTKFKSRKTGQEITSDLLPTDDSRFYVRVENNGNVLVNQTGSEGSFEVEEGSCVIDTAAYLPGDVVKTSHLEMTVEPPSSVLEMTYELPDGGYSLISLAGNPQPVKIHVKDQKKGALTAQQWEALQVQTEGSGGLSWKAEKSPEIGTLLLTPVPKDPDVTKIKVKKGVVELSLKAEVDDPTLRASGEASMQIPIDENRQISLAVTLSEPSAPYDLNEFYEGKPWNGFAARVEKIDPVTGAAIPLTQEEWDALNLKADEGEGNRTDSDFAPADSRRTAERSSVDISRQYDRHTCGERGNPRTALRGQRADTGAGDRTDVAEPAEALMAVPSAARDLPVHPDRRDQEAQNPAPRYEPDLLLHLRGGAEARESEAADRQELLHGHLPVHRGDGSGPLQRRPVPVQLPESGDQGGDEQEFPDHKQVSAARKDEDQQEILQVGRRCPGTEVRLQRLCHRIL